MTFNQSIHQQPLDEPESSEMKPFVFKTFIQPDCVLSLLEEQTNQLTRGSTGLITWQGATCLLDWANWSHLLDNKTVLELGTIYNLLTADEPF